MLPAVLLASIFSVFLGVGANDSFCPNGWVFATNNSYCYKLSDTYMRWDEATSYCQNIGGQFVYITTTAERTYLAALTANLFAQPWLGVRRNTTTGLFYTLAGYQSVSYWATGEPSANGDCATFRGNDPSGMQATQCYNIQPALCKQLPAICPTQTIYGGSVTRAGNITSPGYPVQYYNNLNCLYTIQSPANTYITIIFDPYLTEDYFDWIDVFDGNSSSSPWIGSIDFSYDRKSFESSGNFLTFRFRTDATLTARGWVATWAALANMPPIRQSGTNGTFASPNYPSYYPAFSEQLYYISTASGTQINLTLDFFRTETRYDVLEIYNSSSVNVNNLVANLSGAVTTPWNWISPSNYATLRFTSDAIFQYTGFTGHWNMF